MATNPLGSRTMTQIALVVHDIEQAVAAWAELLGVEPPKVGVSDPVEKAHTEYRGVPSAARAKLAFFAVGPISLELIQPIGENSTWHEQLAAHGPSLHHIAFQVEGMAERIATLAGHGVPLQQRGEFTGGRYAYLDGRARLGTVVELLESDKRHD